jgi:hypothetical protein
MFAQQALLSSVKMASFWLIVTVVLGVVIA